MITNNNRRYVGKWMPLVCILIATMANSVVAATDVTVDRLEGFNLAAQLPDLKGRELRARRIVVPAGGKIALHNHQSRPGIVYVISGQITEYRGNGNGSERLLQTGDTLIEDQATVHRFVNLSAHACELLAVDIPATR